MLQEKIIEFATNFEEYFNYIRKYHRNIIDFVRDFELKLDFNYFLRHANEVVGRKYSVARVEGSRIYLLIKLVEDHITETRLHRGLCSHDLFRS
jgi:sulfite reductase alpha subunit-like flavoprotein